MSFPALDRLAHLPLGVITKGWTHSSGRKLELLGIADRFKVIVTSDATKLSKPDPRIFHHAAAAIGARPEQCGATSATTGAGDVEGAAAAGFRANLARSKRNAGASLADPSRRTVLRIESLLNLVRTHS
jgi:putative hydrolase of the HAD superfamily